MMHRLWVAKVGSLADFRSYHEHMTGAYERRIEMERLTYPAQGAGAAIEGFCGVCRRPSTFWLDYHYAFKSGQSETPNLRERLVCAHCQLNTRMRGVIQFMTDVANITPGQRVYATEMMTPLYTSLTERFPRVQGSEYLQDGTALGSVNAKGIRNEDGTRLTFLDNSFDCIVSLDVMEHIPDYRTALGEISRCLRPGGRLILTAPFAMERQNHLERARIEDGQIRHILPPEYHGDPLNAQGILCFHHFGWDLLDELRAVGLSDAAMYFYWSRKLCYMGGLPFLIMGVKN